MEWQVINNLDYKHYMQEYNINSLLAKIFAYKNPTAPHGSFQGPYGTVGL